ncbi:MAG: sigma-54 dependent transcriptional regulator [Planctomycetes bacterium]|nr:sigma-54 dependent transcriptional regulator [Planctomycetota bacterium]
MAQILILDDEQPLLHALSMELRRNKHECLLAESGRQAFQILEQHSPDLAILDVQLPDVSGLEVLRRLRSDMPEVPVLMITAYGSVDSAVEAIKEGATDYLEKPLDLEELQLVVERELKNSRLRSEVEAYRRERQASSDDYEMVGASPAFEKVRKIAQQIVSVELARASELPTILLLGETGTGKDLLAHYIHYSSGLANRPFVSVNCAGLPRDLVESELFGHEKGAFTSAGNRKQGLFEVAQGGTVYLDEIGDMPYDLQAKLLNVIETHRVRRVGGTREHHVDVRIVAATNADLDLAVAEKRFRSDLYYRLKVLSVRLPPLRERPEDIPALAAHYFERCRRKYKKPELQLSQRLIAALKCWHWPGNIRELAHTIENLVLTSEGGRLALPSFAGGAPPPAPSEAHANAASAETLGADGALQAATGGLPFDFAHGDCTLEGVERQLITAALRYAGGNVSEVARILGVSRGALRHKLDKWSIA